VETLSVELGVGGRIRLEKGDKKDIKPEEIGFNSNTAAHLFL
jgi:hypothetical protein